MFSELKATFRSPWSGLYYEIRVDYTGETYCTCPSWRRNDRHGLHNCKHLIAFRGVITGDGHDIFKDMHVPS